MIVHISHLNILEVFREQNRVMEDIQRSLETLLDKKRNDFPRFYFLSNDDLLQLLAKVSTDPQSIELHLKKLFENVAKIDIDMDDIVRISSCESEEIKIKKVKVMNTPVEKWL